ncbi:MAG: adenylyltransferase/cytidyltransferase family protein [Minisyncoccia bacterium]|jgi:D-beta-D-heptose 7-phosphate kinase/D-beta-D-heptose 1-phosphate adenosyltransferase
MKKPIVVAVSGGFDPVHIGHVHLFRDARKLGDKLIVILMDDAWLMRKKGYVFMPQSERKELLEAICWIDEVVICEPRETYDVAHMLEKLPVDIFANGGADRKKERFAPGADKGHGNEIITPESVVCQNKGIKMVFNVGDTGKPQSSSWLVKNLARQVDDFAKLRETGKAV